MKFFIVNIEDLEFSSNAKSYSEEEINKMVESVEMTGLIAPLCVASHFNKYTVIDGNRRLAALKKLKFTEVPCVSACCPEDIVRKSLEIAGER